MDFFHTILVILHEDLHCESHQHSGKVRIALTQSAAAILTGMTVRMTPARQSCNPALRFSYICHVLFNCYLQAYEALCAASSGDQRARDFEPALDSCDVSSHAPTFLVSNARDFMKVILYIKNVKVKCTVVQALRLCTDRTAHRGSRGIAVLYRH